MKLTYKDGKFELITPRTNSPEIRKPIGFKDANHFYGFADPKARKILDRAFVKRYDRFSESLPSFLDSHQDCGVHWILSRSRSYLAHPPGAGKTCEAIVASFLTDGDGQTLFIVPPQLTVNWEREIVKFAGLLKRGTSSAPHILSRDTIHDTADKDSVNWLADFIIIPDSMLTRDWVLQKLTKIKKKFVAVDEASRFKEASSQRTIALFGGTLKDGTKSQGLVYDCQHAVLMDGSPRPNRNMELWAPTYAMSPESIDFMSQQEFGFKYCGAKINSYGRWEFKHSTNEEELGKRLQKDFMHVVPESALKHPERKRSILFMNEDPRSPEMKAWEKKHLATLNLSDLDEDMNQGDLARHRQELGLSKVNWVSQYVVERLREKNESILLFAWHREVCAQLEARLRKFNPLMVIGGTSEKVREKAFDSFQRGKTKLLVLNIAAGGRGHNLQRADRVIFAEYSWCGENNTQAEKRASRKGSTKEVVRCGYVVIPNSLDEIVLNGVFRKDASNRKVMG